MTDIQRVIDGDTLKTKDDRLRVGYVNTPESEHPDADKNTPEGAAASAFTKAVVPQGTEAKIADYGNDHFGRQVSGVTRNINGTDIDMGLVLLDQDMSSYYTKYGSHPDPTKHDQYKEYYSKHVPYQFGTAREPLSQEQLVDMSQKHKTFTATYQKFTEGTATQEDLDTATAELYKDPEAVVKFRHHLSNWNRPVEEESTETIRGAMRIAMQDPELRSQYNRGVLNGHLAEELVPEKEPSFWEKTSSSFSMLNSVSNVMDLDALWQVRNHGEDIDVTDSELIAGVDQKYHAKILAEAAKYNSHSALIMRDQIVQDEDNRAMFDNMPMYAQFGYGAMAMVVDPLTLIPAAPIAKGVQATTAGIRAWKASRLIQNPAVMATWAAGGATEGAIVNAPRLASDHTYTAREYYLDTAMDAGFGVFLGGAVSGFKYMNSARTARKAEQEALQKHAAGEEVITPSEPVVEARQSANYAQAEQVTREAVQSSTKYAPWESVTEVTQEGFSLAASTVAKSMPKSSPLRILINRQGKLNRRNLSPEERELANQLNADILHLVSAFPDGKVPKNVEKSIAATVFKQKTFKHNNAMADVLQGDVANSTKTLRGYIHSLKNKSDLWEGYDPIPEGSGEFYKKWSDFLSVEHVKKSDDMFELNTNIPKELSYLKDVVELNKMAAKRKDPEFTEQVEELNGLVSARMEQREYGQLERYSDSRQSWGKTVEMSAPEIAAQLRKEGLKPKTPAYSKRLKELRKTGRVEVSDDVNILGKVKSRTVGKESGQYEKLNQETTAEFSAELEELELNLSKHLGGEGDAPTKKEIARAKWLQDALESGRYFKEGMDIVKDEVDQDLLPRSYTVVESQSAYDIPTAQSLATLKDRLNYDILRKLGVKVIKGKSENKHQQARLDKVRTVLTKDKDKVHARMVKAGQWQNVEDVIRVSHTLAEEQKLSKVTTEPQETVTPLTEEELEIFKDNNSGNTTRKLSDEEFTKVTQKVNTSYEKMVGESSEAVAEGLVNFVKSGEQKAFAEARKPKHVLDKVGMYAAKLTEDIGTKLQNSKLTSLEYFGSRVTEIGRGYGGNIRRKATGGVIRDTEFKNSIMKIAPTYVNAMDEFAASRGKGAVGRMNAQNMAGADNKVVKQFNREVFRIQEFRRQGRTLPSGTSKSVLKFVDEWDKYMDYNHGQLVKNNIGGFTAARKVKHYIPHVWKPQNLAMAIKQHGRDKIIELFTQSYKSSIRNGNNVTDVDQAKELAKQHVKWIEDQGLEATAVDQFLPVTDSRAKQRIDLDTTTELDGVSILDILDDEVIGLATKYSNRLAGWVGLAKSTDGMIVSELDIGTFKANLIQEGKDKGIKTKKYEQYFDDTVNLMFGRPTRGGLNQEMRQLKDLTALTRMGGLGTAQLIETGQVITRSMLNLFSSEPVVNKMLKAAGAKDEGLIREIQSISSITDDLEWLERQSVHLDQAELASINKARQLSLWLADKATFGAYKATASRLLGKITGYNAIRRAQSRIAQASFTVDVAKHFRDGSGKMGNARMADLGLTDVDGTDEGLSHVFKTFVEYDKDGLVTKLNADKWPDSVRDQFQYALIRDEAQQIQRTMVGELPPWMNKPMMALLFQFRQMPIVANNKQLARSMAFADKEAVTATLLNTAMAGLVRYSKFAALGTGAAMITGNEVKDPSEDQMQVQKYITQFGIFPDAYDFVANAYTAGQMDEGLDMADKVLGQVPVYGLMSDTEQGITGDAQERVDAAFGLLPLGNTAYGDMMNVMAQEIFTED